MIAYHTRRILCLACVLICVNCVLIAFGLRLTIASCLVLFFRICLPTSELYCMPGINAKNGAMDTTVFDEVQVVMARLRKDSDALNRKKILCFLVCMCISM